MKYYGPIVSDFGPCPYLSADLRWQSQLIQVVEAEDDEIDWLMDHGFRRLGTAYYTPCCEGCQACISLRIPVERFRPNKNQRQIWRRNQDLRVEVQPVGFSPEKYELYRKYQTSRWKKDSVMGPTEFAETYCHQPGKGLDFCYFQGEQLVGVGWVDWAPSGTSSVYFCWDCDPRRSLGIYSVLYEIEWARQNGLKYVYLGLYVEGCSSMVYKSSFYPHQRRYRGQEWLDIDSPAHLVDLAVVKGGTGPEFTSSS